MNVWNVKERVYIGFTVRFHYLTFILAKRSNNLLETQIHHNHTLAARNTSKVKLPVVDLSLSVVCLGLTAVAVCEQILAGASVDYL